MICGKVIFKTRIEANDAIIAFQKDFRAEAGLNRPSYSYFCDDCNGWHIASKTKPKKRTKRTQSESVQNLSEFVKPDLMIKSKLKRMIIHDRNFKIK